MNPDDRHVPACRCIWCASDPGKAATQDLHRTPEQPRRCRFLHKWEDIGLVPLVTMLSECQKCGWQKTWDGFTDTTTYYPPGSWKSQPSEGDPTC